jgi:glycosyltransferase involved in cell wall biosynthesis
VTVDETVSIIMPVFNGEEYIDYSIQLVSGLLEKYRVSFEIIIVDDGSTDATKMRAQRAASQWDNVKVIGYNRNKGKGAAFLYGFRHSKGDIVVLFDSDLDIPPDQIIILLSAMNKTGADVVITNKWHPLSNTIATKYRKFLSRSYNMLVRLFTGLRFTDTQTGAKAFKRHVLEAIAPKLYAKRYAFDVELLLLVAKHGFRVVEVPAIKPIKLNSAFKPREIAYMFLELLSITYRYGRV